jgi:hypothetical protein
MNLIEIYEHTGFIEIIFNDLATALMVSESKMLVGKTHVIEMSLSNTQNCVSVWVTPDRKFDLTFDMVQAPQTASNNELYEALKLLLI